MTTAAVLETALQVLQLIRPLSKPQREEVIGLVMEDGEPAAELAATHESPAPSDGAKPVTPADTRAEIAEARIQQVAELVRAAGGKAQTSWIEEQLGLSQTVTSKHIRRAMERGLIVSPARGLVALPKADGVVAAPVQVKRPAGTSEMTVLERPLAELVKFLDEKGPKTRRDIAARFGATHATILARVEELVRQGRVRVEGDLVHAVKEAANG